MMNRIVAFAVVVVAMPFVVGLARASFGPEQKPVVVEAPKGPHELTALGEPQMLPRRYGVQVVAMPAPPSAEGRAPIADDRLPMADNRSPIAEAVGLSCPDIRAIVTGDSSFAVIAWDDQSQVVSTGKTIRSPAGEVSVRRISAKSITFAQADTTLQCKLLVR